MGRASNWFRTLFGCTKPHPSKKWSFTLVLSRHRHKPPENHAVVTPVSSGRLDRAAVIIQSHFRAYLARRALRALKALVKLQALVRGYIVRKNTASYMRRIQAVAKAQARARATRVLNYQVQQRQSSARSSLHSKHVVLASPEKIKQMLKVQSTKRIPMDDEHPTIARRRTMFHSSDLSHCPDQYSQSFSSSKDSSARQTSLSGEVHSFSTLRRRQDADETTFYTPNSSPRFYSASPSKRGGGAFQPSKTSSPRTRYSDHHPNYMAYTKSSKAKVRSLSAPRQKPYSMDSNSKTNTLKVSSTLANRDYPGSGHLDRLGMPVPLTGDSGAGTSFTGPNWHR